MSNWQEIPKEDVDIDEDDVNIYIGSDDLGNNYVTVKIEYIKELLDKK